MMPLLEERTVRFRRGLTVSENASEVVSLGAGAPGGEQLEPVVAQDAQAQLDGSAATGVASMSNLLAANSLGGRSGGWSPCPGHPWGPCEYAGATTVQPGWSKLAKW